MGDALGYGLGPCLVLHKRCTAVALVPVVVRALVLVAGTVELWLMKEEQFCLKQVMESLAVVAKSLVQQGQ